MGEVNQDLSYSGNQTKVKGNKERVEVVADAEGLANVEDTVVSTSFEALGLLLRTQVFILMKHHWHLHWYQR